MVFKHILKRGRTRFRNIRFANRLAIYLTVFGIFIGYVSFMIHTSLAVSQMGNLVSTMIDDRLAADDTDGDALEMLINKQNNGQTEELFPVLGFVYGQILLLHESALVNTYYYSQAEKVWYKVFIDRGDIIRRSKIRAFLPEFLPSGRTDRIKINTGSYLGMADRLSVMIDVTGVRDTNRYFLEVTADRKGVVKYLGGFHILAVYGAVILLLSIILSRLISIRVARPIQTLSVQAGQIASGNLDVRTNINSRDEIGALSGAINSMADDLKNYIRDIEEQLEAISVMNRIDKAVLSATSSKDLVDRVTSFVSGLYSDCVVGMAIEESENSRYRFLSRYRKGIRHEGDSLPYVSFLSLGSFFVEMSRQFFTFAVSSDQDKMDNINDIFDSKFKYVVNLPIFLQESYAGSLLIGRDDEILFDDKDIAVLRALADQVGVALRSVRYLDDRENLYMGILTSLSKAIDAKSRWTAGHSTRVSEYSEKIALKLNLDEEFRKNLEISALLHDVGKIGVPESILDKPGKLTDEEYSVVKEHPARGADILADIPGYDKIVCGILYHHEDYCGSGYSAGLKGEDIPLMGRIIAVADVYDSLISDRPYRSGMEPGRAREIIISESGRRLDPEIVEIFLSIIDS